jgi:hypothetical protein
VVVVVGLATMPMLKPVVVVVQVQELGELVEALHDLEVPVVVRVLQVTLELT